MHDMKSGNVEVPSALNALALHISAQEHQKLLARQCREFDEKVPPA